MMHVASCSSCFWDPFQRLMLIFLCDQLLTKHVLYWFVLHAFLRLAQELEVWLSMLGHWALENQGIQDTAWVALQKNNPCRAYSLATTIVDHWFALCVRCLSHCGKRHSAATPSRDVERCERGRFRWHLSSKRAGECHRRPLFRLLGRALPGAWFASCKKGLSSVYCGFNRSLSWNSVILIPRKGSSTPSEKELPMQFILSLAHSKPDSCSTQKPYFKGFLLVPALASPTNTRMACFALTTQGTLSVFSGLMVGSLGAFFLGASPAPGDVGSLLCRFV